MEKAAFSDRVKKPAHSGTQFENIITLRIQPVVAYAELSRLAPSPPVSLVGLLEWLHSGQVDAAGRWFVGDPARSPVPEVAVVPALAGGIVAAVPSGSRWTGIRPS